MADISKTIFREYDIRGLVDQDLTEDAVRLVGRALGSEVREQGGRRVVMGRDCRESGPRFARAMVAGLNASGVDVTDLGVVPTPLTYFAAATLPVDGLVMITGSHNPPEYNGLKVGVGKSTLHGEGIQALHRRIAGDRFASGAGKVESHDIVTPYLEYVREEPPAGPPQAQGGRRRRQRHRRRHRGAALPVAGRRGGAALRGDGRPLPQPPPGSDGGEEPRVPQGRRSSRPGPTWGSPTTATPTGWGPSTRRGRCCGATSS